MTLEEATELDGRFKVYKDEFETPTFESLGVTSEKFPGPTTSIYLCGNSLGLMPKRTKTAIQRELDAWGQRGVESHFRHPSEEAGLTSWVDIDLPLLPLLAPLVGAQENEVAVMGTLTSNLNAMLVSFYRPQGEKTKILFEKGAFPSDYYAFLNMVKLWGYDESHLVQIKPSKGETYIRTEDVLAILQKQHREIALICLPGIQYYTGQWFDMEQITKTAKSWNITVGWDLAHAVGNVPLKLHDWEVDFAVWCSYKYLNSGPGAIAGIYVHEKHCQRNSIESFPPRLAGWWGNNGKTRFQMLEVFDPMKSALSYRQSNPSVIDVVSLKASLEIFQEVGGIVKLRDKSIELTNFLLRLLKSSQFYLDLDSTTQKFGFKILTPQDQRQRGCQISVLFQPHSDDATKDVMERVKSYLEQHAIVCDERRPDVIRLAPTPLYNTFKETYIAVGRINEALELIYRDFTP